jgi:acetamidase/formamidase
VNYAVDYHENKRNARLRIAKDLRMKIIKNKECPDPHAEEPEVEEIDPKTKAMLAKEALEIEKLKERQRNDIQAMIEKELVKDEIRLKNEEKARLQVIKEVERAERNAEIARQNKLKMA